MNNEYIDVKIVVFDRGVQHARLLKSLTIGELIGEILKEFSNIGPDSPDKYEIYSRGDGSLLAVGSTIEESNIRPQDELIIQYIRHKGRQMLEKHQFACLRDEAGVNYPIQWQPAIIGRSDSKDPEHNMKLAVDLDSHHHPQKKAVSRKHAQITFSRGRYYLESFAKNNPIMVDSTPIQVDLQKEIVDGDEISIDTIGLKMTFIIESDSLALDPTIPVTPSLLPESNSPEKFQDAFLIIEKAADSTKVGERIELKIYPYVIGRDSFSVSTQKDVSRKHAEVNYDSATQKFSIKDLESANGIFIDGTRIETNEACDLQSGMKIGLGRNLILRFET